LQPFPVLRLAVFLDLFEMRADEEVVGIHRGDFALQGCGDFTAEGLQFFRLAFELAYAFEQLQPLLKATLIERQDDFAFDTFRVLTEEFEIAAKIEDIEKLLGLPFAEQVRPQARANELGRRDDRSRPVFAAQFRSV
jgi:hypothetical protein